MLLCDRFTYLCFVGFVRDLIMNRENDDIDLVIEGDGVQYADKLCEVHLIDFQFQNVIFSHILICCSILIALWNGQSAAPSSVQDGRGDTQDRL